MARHAPMDEPAGPREARGSQVPMRPVPRLAFQRKEAAESLGMSVESFDRYVRPGVRCVYVGSLRLWPDEELRRWLRENSHETMGAEHEERPRAA